jgi:hypothetical protein
VEPNNEAATATAFGSSLCGALTTGADVDWLSFTLPSGATTLTLTATKDAVFAIGNYVKGRCLVIATGRRSAQVTVAGGGAALCAQVSSPSRAAQTYTLAKK